MTVRLLVLAIAGLVALPSAACGGSGSDGNARGSDADLIRRLDEALAAQWRYSRAVGMAAAVVRNGRLVWSGGGGVGDLEDSSRVTGNTAFGIGSVTKTFVAALAVRLAEDGLWSLDDPVARWLPDHGLDPKITVRRLLGHTSGLFGVDESRGYQRAVDADHGTRWTPARTLRYARRPPYFAPGTGWHYSDTNYVLAGLAMERATGSPVAATLESSVLAPLGIRDAGLQPDVAPPESVAHGHGASAGAGGMRDLSRGMRWVPYDSLASSEWAGGGMWATAEGVATFGDALFRGRLVGGARLKEIVDFEPTAFESYIGYGLGVGRRHVAALGGDVWGSIGRVAGFSADLWHVPSRRLTVAVLVNDERADPTRVADALLGTVADRG